MVASVPESNQPHHLDRRQGGDDPLGELHLGEGRRAEALCRAPSASRIAATTAGMAVPEDLRPVAADVVDVAAAVLALEPGALRGADEDRLAADAAEGAHRRAHAARHRPAGAGVEGGPGQLNTRRRACARGATNGPSAW